MKPCCEKEARALERHRDVATCDTCGALLLAYGNDRDFERTLEELTQHGVEHETITIGKLRIVAKTRASNP